MNHFFWKNWVIILLILLPVVLFSAACGTVSWQSQKVLALPYKGAITISPNERLIANASSDEQGLVSVLVLSNGQEVKHRVLQSHVSCLAFSPDGRHLAIGWSKSSIHKIASDTKRIGVSLWDFKRQYRQFEIATGTWVFDTPTQLRFSPDAKTLWMASTDNLRAWSISSGKLKWQWRNAEGRDSSLPFFSTLSMDCRLNFRSDSSGYTVWDIKTGKRLLRTKLPYLADADLDFSPDASVGTYYADTPKGILNYLIDTRTGRVLWKSKGDSGITLTADKAIRRNAYEFEVCDTRNGRILYTLPANARSVPLSSTSRRWLYTINDKNHLLRQRLR